MARIRRFIVLCGKIKRRPYGNSSLRSPDKSRAATLCRRTKLVGRQPFAAKQGVSACRLQTPPVGMGMPTYILVGRQPFAAGQGVSACRLQTPPVGMGMPTYIKAGRQPFAAGQGVSACRLQTPPVGMGMPTYEKLRHRVGQQPFAAGQS